MIDMKFLRENPEAVKENIRKKFQEDKLPLVDRVLTLDKENRETIQAAQDLRTQRNALSKQVGVLMGQAKKDNDPAKLEGLAAKAAFDALDYDTAYIFRWGFREGVTNAGVTGRVTAAQLDQERGIDVYVVGRDFQWTYVHTHEDGWMGPYFCRLGQQSLERNG